MSEQFKLEDGGTASCGLVMPDEAEQLLMANAVEFPDSLLRDKSDIEKALKGDVYKEKRKFRARRMRNQSRLGKCNASSNASGLEQVFESQGMPDVALSDCHLYSRINGGQDRGSALIRSFEAVQKDGISPMDVQVGGMTRRLPNDAYNRRQFPKDVLEAADREAQRFKGFEFFKVSDRDFKLFCVQVASALSADLPVIFAWHVGNNSMRLRNGYTVVGRGVGNHSNVFHSAKWVGGNELVHPDNQNSWGPCKDERYGSLGGNWGEGGFGLFTMEDAFACVRYHGCYVMTSAIPDPNDPALQ